PLALDDYTDNRRTGSFILIDPADGTTLTAGMAGEAFDTVSITDASTEEDWV
ncbi:sulfate adenylyltransferase subunit 1, partial [Kitasatospora sp. SolWspMP-SS2h]